MSDNQQKPNVKKPLLVKKNNTANTSTINSSSSTKVNTANNQLSAPAKTHVKASPTLANTNTQATTQANPVTKTSNAPKPTTPTTQATLVKGATPAKVVAKTPPITKAPSQQPSSQPSSQPLSKTSPQPKQPAQVVKAVSIAPITIERAVADETLTKAQMDITVKISELPSEVNTNEQGVKEFYVKANEREVFIAINSKQYNKLVTAQQTWPIWIGRIAGKLGQATKDGFILDKANVQVFERIIKVVEPAKTGNEKQVSNMQADRKASDEPAITHRKYKEICKLFDPYLEKGKLPTQEEIARLLAPYNLDRREINQLLNRLLGRNHLKRETGFLIEKTYFKLLGEWDSNYFQLVTKVANELEMNEKAVATWLGFIHQPHGVIRRIALPPEEIIEQVIKLYQQYLEGEEPPKASLHNWISENMTEPLNTNTIHKVVADYREKLKKNKFGNRVKPKQLLLDAATENNDKTNNNETSNSGNSAITNGANNNQIEEQ